MKALKIELTKWNVEVFTNVGKKKNNLLDELCELDNIAEGRSLSESLRKEEITKDEDVYSSWRSELEADVKGSLVERGRFAQVRGVPDRGGYPRVSRHKNIYIKKKSFIGCQIRTKETTLLIPLLVMGPCP